MSKTSPYNVAAIQQLIDNYYKKNLSDIIIIEKDAVSLYEKRRAQFEIFAKRHSAEIASKFNLAIDRLDEVHKFSTTSYEINKACEKLAEMSPIQLLSMTCSKLDAQTTTDEYAEVRVDIRKNILICAAQADKNHVSLNLSDMIEKDYSTTPELKALATSTAGNLYSMREALSGHILIMQCASLHMTIGRGILYNAIIRKQGSKLELWALQKRIVEIIKDLPTEVWGLAISGLPLGLVKKSYDICITIINKEDSLQNLSDQHEENEAMLTSFADTYAEALLPWISWYQELFKVYQQSIDKFNDPFTTP